MEELAENRLERDCRKWSFRLNQIWIISHIPSLCYYPNHTLSYVHILLSLIVPSTSLKCGYLCCLGLTTLQIGLAFIRTNLRNVTGRERNLYGYSKQRQEIQIVLHSATPAIQASRLLESGVAYLRSILLLMVLNYPRMARKFYSILSS